MGNMIFCSSFTTYTAIASTNNTSHPTTNITNIDRLKIDFRTNSTAGCTVLCDLGSVKNIGGILIDDVNFSALTIAHAQDTAFGSATNSTYTVENDTVVMRRKYFVPLSTGIRAFKIITGGAVDGSSYVKIGRVAVLSSSTFTLNRDPGFPYGKSGNKKIKTNEFETGGIEPVNISSYRRRQIDINFPVHQSSYESDIWALNSIDPDSNVFIFENKGDYSKAYIAIRISDIDLSVDMDNNSINTISYLERI